MFNTSVMIFKTTSCFWLKPTLFHYAARCYIICSNSTIKISNPHPPSGPSVPIQQVPIGLFVTLGQFTRNYTQTVKRAADNKRRYAPGWVHSTCLLRGFPKGAAPHLAHDFAEQSVVCYTLCRRCPENTVAAGEGKGI